jgi:protein-disulfide isomerase
MHMSPPEEQNLTRKERREQARADRKAAEAQHSQMETRRKRLAQLVGAVVAAVVVIAVVVAVASSGGGKSHIPQKGTTGETTDIEEVSSLLAGIPQAGNVLGNPKAPVTLQYFGDLECPICREFTLGALPAIISKEVRTGRVKLEYHSMETATREPEIFREQQSAALAAGKQDLMWYFLELFYHEQGQEDTGYVTPAYLRGRAEQVHGLNVAKWEEERHNPAWETVLEKDAEEVGRRGFTGTPSFLLGKTGGELSVFDAPSLEEASAFEAAISSLIKK